MESKLLGFQAVITKKYLLGIQAAGIKFKSHRPEKAVEKTGSSQVSDRGEVDGVWRTPLPFLPAFLLCLVRANTRV